MLGSLFASSRVTDHPRPNRELRFTFRDQKINAGELRQGDVLVFERLEALSIPRVTLRALIAKARVVGDVKLLIVDPVVTAVAGDSHRNAQVRRDLAPLVPFGHRNDIWAQSHYSTLRQRSRAEAASAVASLPIQCHFEGSLI
jgi:hypothetical protein